MCTIASVRDTPRNVWVAFTEASHLVGSTAGAMALVEQATAEVGKHPEDFPHGWRVSGSWQDHSALVVLHKVDPES